MRRLRSKELYKKWPLFYFLCQEHLKGIYDKHRDLKGSMYKEDRGVQCDYPWPNRCQEKATNEYFPNLIKIHKEAKRRGHYRIRMLREMPEFSHTETSANASSGAVVKWSQKYGG